LYLPWRLAHGALLYRDADDFYGPLSQYLNAGLFRIFGPGMMVLVAANLVVFTAICALLYCLLRAAWGWGAALIALLVFISVFGFAQYVEFGNYNYATPYSHEATHGLLVCLLVVSMLRRWLRQGGRATALVVGLLLGLALLLKAEFILAAAVPILLASWYRPPQRAEAACWMLGCLVPSALFLAWFALHAPWGLALEYTGRAWWNVLFTTRYTDDPSQFGFLGLDEPLRNGMQHLLSTAASMLIVAMVIAGARWSDRRALGREAGLAAFLLVATCALLGSTLIHWIEVGKALVGLVATYLLVSMPRRDSVAADNMHAGRAILRVLLAAMALALMVRMLLNGRIYQFGFVQAALASLVVVCVLLAELPARAGLGVRGRAVAVCALLALLASGVCVLTSESRDLLTAKTFPVGEGRDRFFAYDPRTERTGEFVRAVVEALAQLDPDGRGAVLVLPDGQMINYLSRTRSPVPAANFFSSAMARGREKRTVESLRARPPEWVVIISRDLREFGVTRYGDREGQGREILGWLHDNYRIVASSGGDPLQGQDGVLLWARAGDEVQH
jgi:hypothetical protein